MPPLPFLGQNWRPKKYMFQVDGICQTLAALWKASVPLWGAFCVFGVTSLSQQSRPTPLSSGLALIVASSLGGAAIVSTITRVFRGRKRAKNHAHGTRIFICLPFGQYLHFFASQRQEQITEF